MSLNGDKTKLKDADINKVDFVPAGAQQHSRISIFKSIINAIKGEKEQSTDFNETLLEMKEDKMVNTIMCELWDYSNVLHQTIEAIIISDLPDKSGLIQGALDQFSAVVATSMSTNIKDNTIAKIGRKMSAERMESLRACVKQLNDLISSAEESKSNNDVKVEEPNNKKPDKADNNGRSEGNMSDKITKAVFDTLPKEVQEHITSLEAIAKSATPPAAVEDIYKGLPENIVAVMKKQSDDLRNATEMIAKMRDESIEKEFVAKAAAMTKNLGIDAAKFGKVLKSIHAANPELATEVENVIKAADEAVSKGNLFKEAGKDTNGNDVPATSAVAKADAWAKIETLAEGRVTKGEAKTKAEAIDAVLKTAEGRKLYEIYTGKISG